MGARSATSVVSLNATYPSNMHVLILRTALSILHTPKLAGNLVQHSLEKVLSQNLLHTKFIGNAVLDYQRIVEYVK